MRKTTLTLLAGAAAIAVSGTALAQGRQAPQGDLTRPQAQQHAAQMFDRLDVNGDGTLDAADREAQRKARFDRLDNNSDGAISYDEFTAARTSRGERPEGVRGQRGSHRGERMGLHGMRGMGMRGPGRMSGVDGDRATTRAEFEAAMLARFDAADANKDGTVTAAERKAQRDGMRQQMRERRDQSAS